MVTPATIRTMDEMADLLTLLCGMVEESREPMAGGGLRLEMARGREGLTAIRYDDGSWGLCHSDAGELVAATEDGLRTTADVVLWLNEVKPGALALPTRRVLHAEPVGV